MRRIISATGVFIGMIFGAGIFALPYAVSRAGLWWGLFHFFFAFFLVLFLHLIYAEIVFFLPGNRRFVGYAGILLGKKAKILALLNVFFSYYGALFIYAVLGGFFLLNIFSFYPSYYWSFIFLFLGSLCLFFNLKKIGEINFYLTLPILILIIIAAFLLFPYFEVKNFLKLNNFFSADWFLPYGVFIFSFSGFAVIPDLADFFKKNNSLKEFKSVIKISQIIVATFYFIFIASVLAVLGDKTSENVIYDISGIIGGKGFLLFSLIGFLSVFTSFIALAQDFKDILFLDFKLPRRILWFLIIAPVAGLLFFLNQKFIELISLVGAFGLGIYGIFILLMAEKFKKQIQCQKEIIWSSFTLKFLFILFILGAIYELWQNILF